MPSYLTGLENNVGDTYNKVNSKVPIINPKDVTWKENVDKDEGHKKIERVVPESTEMEETSEESNTIMDNLLHFMDQDLELFMDAIEDTEDPVVMYMNNRVDDIMHGVHAGMEHPV